MRIVKVVALSLTLMSICLCGKAQTPSRAGRFEVSVSLGGTGRPIGAAGNPSGHGSVMADVFYTPLKWFSVGVGVGLHNLVDRPTDVTMNPNLMVYLRGNWYTGERFRVYSLVGWPEIPLMAIGDYWGFSWRTFQLTPVGVSYGRRLFGFAELGTGYMYTPVRAGIGYRF